MYGKKQGKASELLAVSHRVCGYERAIFLHGVCAALAVSIDERSWPPVATTAAACIEPITLQVDFYSTLTERVRSDVCSVPNIYYTLYLLDGDVPNIVSSRSSFASFFVWVFFSSSL